ncbi:AAA family ATPase [Sulfitobacter sp. AS92]|uniref:AAA family ATPase n=1 Tax=Sulfitobacter sp. AS92 TaxID=3135783 RepID=UPI00316DE9B6
MTKDGAWSSPFLPAQARRCLLNQRDGESRALAMPGAILFCDLTGFSRRGAEGVTRSERGAEALQAVINDVFACLARAIEAHGGSILYFAGDAVTAHWPREAGWSKAIANAVSCGLAIQKDIANVNISDPLIIRAGVSAGDLWLLDVADAERARHAVFCGPALASLKGLDTSANGVRLTAQAESLAGAGLRVEHGIAWSAERQGPGALEPPELDIGPWLRRHQRAGRDLGADWVAEFRHAHVLFARFPDFAFTGAQDLAGLAALLRAVAAAVEDKGGALLQVCCDDKGLVAVAAWGLASCAWEDAAERATLAGLELERTEGVTVSVAVAAGKVFAGLVGTGTYAQYVVVGDAINRAAAMSVRAVAPVVLDDGTCRAVARRFDTRQVAETVLKGQTSATGFHAVVAERLRGLAHAGEMIGRETETARLAGIVERIKIGTASDFAITGVAGLGKSRLAVWFEGHLADAGLPYLRIQADGLRRAISYWPFASLVADLLDLAPDAGPTACRDAAAALLGSEAAPFLPLLSPVLPTELSDSDATRGLVGAGRAERTRSLIADLVMRLLPPGLPVMIVEDAHWLDSASWQLLDLLSRRAPLSLCFVTRPLSPDDLPSEARRFLDPGRVEMLELQPLGPAESGVLGARKLGADAAAPPLEALLFEKAAGHPLFTSALAQALEGRGLVRIEGGYAHLRLGEAGLAGIAIPTDAAGAAQERIAALSPAEQLTIKCAAILGRDFTNEALAALHPSASPDTVAGYLRSIAATGLIETAGPGAWCFHHAIVADAAYRSLVTGQAQRLHVAAAANIAQRAGDAPEQADLALLAYHYERAGEREPARRTLIAAAEGARRAYANIEVVDFLTRVMRLSEEGGMAVDPLTLGRWRYDIAHALRAIGQYQRAEEFLKSCLVGIDRTPPETGGQAARAILSGYAAFRLRPHRSAQAEARRAPLVLAAEASMMLSEIHYELNKIPFALAEVLRGANLARRAGGDSATLAKLCIGLSLISTSLPWALDGDDLQRTALAMVDRLDDQPTEAWVCMVSGNYETGKGGWSDGEKYFRRSMVVAEACGERKTWETAASTLANLSRLEGRFEAAMGWSDVTLAASRDRGVVHGIIWSHNGRARDLLCLSRLDEMREDVAALERLLQDPANAQDANDNNKLVFHYSRAVLALEDGENAVARNALEEALAIVARTARPQVYMTQNAPFYCDLLWALRERGCKRDELLAHQALVARSARRIARQFRAGAPMAALAAGDHAWLRGYKKKAEMLWRSAVDHAQVRGMRYNAAHALDRLTRTKIADEAAARDRHLAELAIPLPRLWRLSDRAGA